MRLMPQKAKKHQRQLPSSETSLVECLNLAKGGIWKPIAERCLVGKLNALIYNIANSCRVFTRRAKTPVEIKEQEVARDRFRREVEFYNAKLNSGEIVLLRERPMKVWGFRSDSAITLPS
jgi:hypothetical protein